VEAVGTLATLALEAGPVFRVDRGEPLVDGLDPRLDVILVAREHHARPVEFQAARHHRARRVADGLEELPPLPGWDAADLHLPPLAVGRLRAARPLDRIRHRDHFRPLGRHVVSPFVVRACRRIFSRYSAAGGRAYWT